MNSALSMATAGGTAVERALLRPRQTASNTRTGTQRADSSTFLSVRESAECD